MGRAARSNLGQRFTILSMPACAVLAVFFSACASTTTPPGEGSQVQRHADRAFGELKGGQDATIQPTPDTDSKGSPATSDKTVEVPLGKVEVKADIIRATGYASLRKGLMLCQHSADLAARIELSKLVRVEVNETSRDRQREKSGKEYEQDIEVVREARVNQVLTEVRIVDRQVDKEAGTCISTAEVPRRNLFPPSPGPSTGN